MPALCFCCFLAIDNSHNSHISIGFNWELIAKGLQLINCRTKNQEARSTYQPEKSSFQLRCRTFTIIIICIYIYACIRVHLHYSFISVSLRGFTIQLFAKGFPVHCCAGCLLALGKRQDEASVTDTGLARAGHF